MLGFYQYPYQLLDLGWVQPKLNWPTIHILQTVSDLKSPKCVTNYSRWITRPAGARSKATAGPQRRGHGYKAQNASRHTMFKPFSNAFFLKKPRKFFCGVPQEIFEGGQNISGILKFLTKIWKKIRGYQFVFFCNFGSLLQKYAFFKIRHFQNASLSKYAIFKIRHFQNTPFSKYPIFKIRHFQNTPFSKYPTISVTGPLREKDENWK